ncbi:MAG: hypothetical protein L6R40_005452 [Gallowayella cf. fulva]|nr:MAG: hypothetical protein L6R40_005452 [Xanthomendoza cf. fulva]
MGFSISLLQDSQNTSSHLELPIDPNTPSLEVDIAMSRNPGSRPSRGVLVMSIAVETYWWWRDFGNHRISRATTRRGEAPFDTFVFQQTPSAPRNWVAPLQLGIGYAKVLMYVCSVDEITSGHITASIKNPQAYPHDLIDTLEIKYYPRVGSASAKPPNGTQALEQTIWANETFNSILRPGNPSSVLRMTWEELDDRWIRTLRQLLFYLFEQSTTDLVAEKLQPTSGSQPPHRFWRVPNDHSILDFVEVSIFTEAVEQRLTFRTLLEEVLLWGSEVVLVAEYDKVGVLRKGDLILASMVMTINGGQP